MREAEENVVAAVSALKMAVEDFSRKMAEFTNLKQVNLNLEHDVLADIKARLNRKP